MINASKDNVQPIWEIIEAAESIDNRSQLINVLLHADQDALKFMGGDDPILRILAAWVQDLAQEASTEHLLLSLFKVFERMPSRLNNVRDSGLLAAVKKLRGNDARKETRAGANELWAVWDKRFKEHNRQAAVAAAQAAAKASMAIDPLLGLDSIKQAQQPPLGGTLLPHQLLQPQPLQQQQPQDGQLQQQQQQQNGQQDVPMEEAKPQGVSVEQLDEEDRARIQALEAKLAEDERLAQEAEQKRSQEQQQQGSSSAPRLPRIPTFDEYSKKRHSKKERARSKKEGATGRSAAREDTAPGAAGVAPDAAPAAAPGAPASAPAAAGTSSGGAAVPSPLYNIVTKMLTSAVNKGELQKDRFKVMRKKVIAKVASGKAEAEVHSEPYVRQNMDKIKRLVKSYIEAKQAKGKGGS
ncbi:hypothetical protein DUNSADRAFT_17159 [Dunaliella salina]|uniref:TFIIS N-terminal domain-containing protein n=1 Tax=Dunaliella salina TaxID=3046 RepID=A0ABQ7H0E4_DUNSA|nr:hypothetical protein DUNSADRAFT_17159 [Dunaliella salina]|eukprot:KAF5840315.1 hypothetical protein DUNSADRAFT_17159 [Dunaliella salina]